MAEYFTEIRAQPERVFAPFRVGVGVGVDRHKSPSLITLLEGLSVVTTAPASCPLLSTTATNWLDQPSQGGAWRRV